MFETDLAQPSNLGLSDDDNNNNNNVVLYPIYHNDNPIWQPWTETLAVLAREMEISLPRGPLIVVDNDNNNDA